jgi:hypothetical protein
MREIRTFQHLEFGICKVAEKIEAYFLSRLLTMPFALCELSLYSVQMTVDSQDQLLQFFGVPFFGDSLRQFAEKSGHFRRAIHPEWLSA